MALEDALLALFMDVIDARAGTLPARFVPDEGTIGAARPLSPNALPCLRWLEQAEAIASLEGRPLVSFLRREGARLRWGQTYGVEDFGEAFLRNYGWLEVFGSRGHFAHPTIAGGLLLLGPETHYPDHHHLAEEIYIPLTGGSEWRMGSEPLAVRQAGEVIHHASNVPHAMRTGREPLLALYLWCGGPLDQKSEIAALRNGDKSRSGEPAGGVGENRSAANWSS